jgi:hypothetical protein
MGNAEHRFYAHRAQEILQHNYLKNIIFWLYSFMTANRFKSPLTHKELCVHNGVYE